MPLTAFLTFLLFAAPSPAVHKDRIESARTLKVEFKTGEVSTFTLSKATITAVSLRIGENDFTVPASECAKLRDIRFETVAFLWNGSSKSAAQANYFYLQFDMGPESARAFGELPQVQLMFSDGQFDEATVKKKLSEVSWQDSKL